MKLTTAVAVFVTTMAIASQFDVVASSASVLDETDPPKTRKVRTATILRFIIYTLVSYRIVSYRIVSYLILSFVSFVSYSFRCDDYPSQHQDQECQEG